jgi:RHH-type proline utilization regulon transcriptional repressor/proline dehydrogenase/delta 1-pyrroline-5-carboxylate dehydrogenase
MGEPLYEQVTGKVADGKLNRPCRIYAPVGTHETLLAYLVRRLLENGANTSFVNRIADTTLPLDELVADPVQAVEKWRTGRPDGLPHPKIALPRELYGKGRVNSAGLDLANEHRLASLLCPAQQRAAEMAGQTDAGAARCRRRNAAGDQPGRAERYRRLRA